MLWVKTYATYFRIQILTLSSETTYQPNNYDVILLPFGWVGTTPP